MSKGSIAKAAKSLLAKKNMLDYCWGIQGFHGMFRHDDKWCISNGFCLVRWDDRQELTETELPNGIINFDHFFSSDLSGFTEIVLPSAKQLTEYVKTHDNFSYCISKEKDCWVNASLLAKVMSCIPGVRSGYVRDNTPYLYMRGSFGDAICFMLDSRRVSDDVRREFWNDLF